MGRTLPARGPQNTFTEIIGRGKPFGGEPSADVKSRAFVGKFDSTGDVLAGSWTWPGGGYSTPSTRIGPG